MVELSKTNIYKENKERVGLRVIALIIIGLIWLPAVIAKIVPNMLEDWAS